MSSVAAMSRQNGSSVELRGRETPNLAEDTNIVQAPLDLERTFLIFAQAGMQGSLWQPTLLFWQPTFSFLQTSIFVLAHFCLSLVPLGTYNDEIGTI